MLGKTAYWEYAGQRYSLAFSSDVMFDMMDMSADGNPVSVLDGFDREDFDRVKKVAMMMNHTAVKRAAYLGDAEKEIPEGLLDCLTPAEMLMLRTTLDKAIALGYGREVPDDPNEEVDLVLSDIEKKA